MSQPISVYHGKGFIAYDVVIVGVGFPPGYDLKGFCTPTVEALLEVSPFALSREAIAFWCVDSRDMDWFEEDGNRVVGGRHDSLANAFRNFQAMDPRFPPWHHCAQISLRRGGIVVLDYRGRGYADAVPTALEEEAPGPALSLCELVRFGADATISGLSPAGFAFALTPALPLGGSVLDDPSRPGQVRAVSAQIAKAVGLLVGLGDEFEGLDDNGIFEGTNAALPLNLHSPVMYDSSPANTSDGTNRSLGGSVALFWQRYRKAQGFDILEPGQSSLPENKILVVHYNAGHISRTPIGTELEPAGSIKEGVHLIEGGAGWRRGVYRARPNCIMRFPWRYTPTFDTSGVQGTFDEVSFCKPCESMLQEIFVGYSSFKLGQMVVAPSGVDVEAENSLGHLLADFVVKEGTEQPELPSYARASAHTAALARIGQFFATRTRLRIEYARQYRFADGTFEPAVAPLGPSELGVTVPAVRARPSYDSDILWARRYDAAATAYPDMNDTLALALASGIAGAIDATGMGRIVNEFEEPSSLEYVPLRPERIDELPPGTVLELWKDRETAIQAVTSQAINVSETDHGTVIVLQADDGGLTFVDHTGSHPKSLLDAYDFIFAARWFGYRTAAPATTSESLRAAAIEAAAGRNKEDAFNRLELVIWARGVGEPQLSQEAIRWYGAADYETTDQYTADLGLLRDTLTSRAIALASSVEHGVDKLIEKVEAVYLSDDDSELLRDDLAWSLGFLSTILPAWVESPFIPGPIPGFIGWRGFWEHTNGVSTPFSSMYPNPDDFPTTREFVESAMELPLGLDTEDLKNALWSRISIRHPIVLAIDPSPTDSDYNDVVVLISEIFASEPDDRDAKVREFVESRLASWCDANKRLRQALTERTEDTWYLLLPLLMNAAAEEIGRWTYPNLYEYAVDVVIKEELAPEAGRDDAWEVVGEFAIVLGLAAMVLIPYAGAMAGGAAAGAAGSATLTFEGLVAATVGGADAFLIVAVSGRDLFQSLELGDDAERLQRIEKLSPILFGEQRHLFAELDSNVFSKIVPILLLVGATGLGAMSRWAARARARRAGVLPPGRNELRSLANKYQIDPARKTQLVARTDVDELELVTFEGLSRKPKGLAKLPAGEPPATLQNLDVSMTTRRIKSEHVNPMFSQHAEEMALNRLDQEFLALGYTADDLSGKTVWIHMNNAAVRGADRVWRGGVCNASCLSNLGLFPNGVTPTGRMGILKQFSKLWPNLTIRVTAEGGPAVARSADNGGNIWELVIRGMEVIE